MKNNRCFLLLFVLAVGWYACTENTYTHGKILYENFCANCHMEDGAGLEGVIPPLAGADFLKNRSAELPCIIHAGMKGEIVVNCRTYNAEMPGSPKLTEFEVTNVINYINTAWGNDLPIVKHLDVRAALKACKKLGN